MKQQQNSFINIANNHFLSQVVSLGPLAPLVEFARGQWPRWGLWAEYFWDLGTNGPRPRDCKIRNRTLMMLGGSVVRTTLTHSPLFKLLNSTRSAAEDSYQCGSLPEGGPGNAILGPSAAVDRPFRRAPVVLDRNHVGG